MHFPGKQTPQILPKITKVKEKRKKQKRFVFTTTTTVARTIVEMERSNKATNGLAGFEINYGTKKSRMKSEKISGPLTFSSFTLRGN